MDGGGGRPASATGTPFVGGGGALAADALTTRFASMKAGGGGFTPPKTTRCCGMKPFGGDFQPGCSDGGCVDAVNLAFGGYGNFQYAVKHLGGGLYPGGGAGYPSGGNESGCPFGLGQCGAFVKTSCRDRGKTGGLSPLSIWRLYLS